MGRVSYVPGASGSSSARMRAHCPSIVASLAQVRRAMWHESFIEPGLRELIRLQAASVNQCMACWALRYTPGKDAGATEERTRYLPDNFENGPFSQREKLALRFATAMIRTPHDIDDVLFADLRAEFSEPELVDIGLSVSVFYGLGLFNVVFDAEPEPYGTEYAV